MRPPVHNEGTVLFVVHYTHVLDMFKRAESSKSDITEL